MGSDSGSNRHNNIAKLTLYSSTKMAAGHAQAYYGSSIGRSIVQDVG